MSEPVEILLVEDNANDAELTLRALRASNITNSVHVARDGVEALEYLLPDNPDLVTPTRLVILDLKLPRLDGHEVLRRMRSDSRTRLIPVVVLTSSQEERDLVASYADGVNSYVVKPLDFDQFAHAVNQIGLYWVLLNQTPR